MGEITITLDSVDKKYEYENLDVTFESTDEEVVEALNPVLLEEEGFDFKEAFEDGDYTIKRMDESQNIYIFPKSTAGR